MSNSGGKITAPVSVANDIAPVLGVGSYSLRYMCSNQHGRINPWARYKPVRYPSLSPGPNEKWWKAWDGNCGISPKRISGYRDSVNWANGSMNGWEYQAPTGGDSSPYRTLFFDGYNHKARPPIGNFYVPAQASNQHSSNTFGASCAIMMPSQGTLTDELNMGDFSEIADCYFGIYAKQRNGSQSRRVTGTGKIGEGNSFAEMRSYGMPSGTWDVYPFLSTIIIGQDDNDKVADYFSIPLVSAKSISIVSSYVNITILPGFLPSTGGFVDVVVKVRNSSTSTLTFNNNWWFTRYGDAEFQDPMKIGEASGRIDNFSVAANTIKEMSITVSVSQDLIEDMGPRVWISLNSGNYVSSSMFMMDAGTNM